MSFANKTQDCHCQGKLSRLLTFVKRKNFIKMENFEKTRKVLGSFIYNLTKRMSKDYMVEPD